jgi:hypothetical protein
MPTRVTFTEIRSSTTSLWSSDWDMPEEFQIFKRINNPGVLEKHFIINEDNLTKISTFVFSDDWDLFNGVVDPTLIENYRTARDEFNLTNNIKISSVSEPIE